MPKVTDFHRGRRHFLKLGAISVAGAMAARTGAAWATPARSGGQQERSLTFHHLHTGETLRVPYWSAGEYHADALEEVAYVLRDHRTGDVHPIAPHLLDVLYELRTQLGTRKAFHVICGYRSPKTNEMLRSRGRGVAKHSLHMEGKAIDVRIPGVALKNLRATALSLGAGGVGYYARSNFVHVDIGRPRFW